MLGQHDAMLQDIAAAIAALPAHVEGYNAKPLLVDAVARDAVDPLTRAWDEVLRERERLCNSQTQGSAPAVVATVAPTS